MWIFSSRFTINVTKDTVRPCVDWNVHTWQAPLYLSSRSLQVNATHPYDGDGAGDDDDDDDDDDDVGKPVLVSL